MAFFSFQCAKSGYDIPVPVSNDLPAEAREVVQVCPDDTIVTGLYDGYGRVGGMDIYSNIIQALNLDESGDYGDLKDHEAIDDPDHLVRLVRADYYDGERFSDLDPSAPSKSNGLVTAQKRNAIKESLNKSFALSESNDHRIDTWKIKSVGINIENFIDETPVEPVTPDAGASQLILPNDESAREQARQYILENADDLIKRFARPRRALYSELTTLRLDMDVRPTDDLASPAKIIESEHGPKIDGMEGGMTR